MIEGIPATALAEEFGTPAYVYSSAAILNAFGRYSDACEGRNASVYYAVKANSNLSVLRILANVNAGFDIVSGGELARVIAAGGDPARACFSGVGKTSDEIKTALLNGIGTFNVESIGELERINRVSWSIGQRARISLRINPDVDAKTHPYISTGLRENKFGIAYADAIAAYKRAANMSNLEVVGIDCHIGSQITEISPYIEALDRVLDLVEKLEEASIPLRKIDVGGGLGISYRDEKVPDARELVGAIVSHVEGRGHGHREVVFEPGRSVVGNAGVLLTRVEHIKPSAEKIFVIVDAAMNDLARPSIYGAYHRITGTSERLGEEFVCDVVGPVCESGDWLGKERRLNVDVGDVLAIHSCGAYGFTMSSNYNSRPRPIELMIDDQEVRVARPRETLESLFAAELAGMRAIG